MCKSSVFHPSETNFSFSSVSVDLKFNFTFAEGYASHAILQMKCKSVNYVNWLFDLFLAYNIALHTNVWS